MLTARVVGINPRIVQNLLLLILSFALLLLGAEVFTNGIEWLGHRLGISESATGSVLAAVGTALPETMIPVIAIIHGLLTGTTESANHVGVGAILGAPFMLATIAMFLVGASVLWFSERRSKGKHFQFNPTATRRDLVFFITGYSLALIAAFLPSTLSIGSIPVAYVIAVLLVLLYLVYVQRSLRTGGLIEDDGLDSLYLGWLAEHGERRLSDDGSVPDHRNDPHRALVLLQTVLALGFILAGARVFVTEVQYLSVEVFHFPTAVLALLIAPLATELPEKFNSIIWISRDKDMLAIGNITGAMAFQSTLPVTIGILFTSWNLTLTWGTTGFLNALSAILALTSGILLYLRVRTIDGRSMRPVPFFVGGLFYAAFIAVVIYHVFYLGVSVGGA